MKKVKRDEQIINKKEANPTIECDDTHDGHPNSVGHQIIARVLTEKLQKS